MQKAQLLVLSSFMDRIFCFYGLQAHSYPIDRFFTYSTYFVVECIHCVGFLSFGPHCYPKFKLIRSLVHITIRITIYTIITVKYINHIISDA